MFAYAVLLSSIVHIHLTLGVSSFRKKFFFWPSVVLGKKVILHLHTPSAPGHENPKLWKKNSAMFRRADRVIALSKSWKKEIEQQVPGARVQVLYNAVPGPRREDVISAREKMILYVGVLDKRKGYEELIRAFSMLPNKFSEWKLEFAGNGEIERAMKLAQELGVSDRIKFHGWVSGDQKSALFKAARVFCLPSHAEGFPISLLEALSWGLPALVTPVGGIPDELVDYEDVLYVEPGNPGSIAAGIERLLNDEVLMEKLGKRGVELTAGRFSFDQTMVELDALYQELTGIRKKGDDEQ